MLESSTESCILYKAHYIYSSTFLEEPPQWAAKKMETRLILKPVGSTAEMKCQADGKPTPRIEWRKNGLPFTQREVGTVSKNREIGIGKSRGYNIIHVEIPFFNKVF